MSRTYSRLTNKHQKPSKVYFQQYLYNANEPQDYMSISSPAELEVELRGSSEFMRQGFRHYARRLRSR